MEYSFNHIFSLKLSNFFAKIICYTTVSYTHLTLPTKLEV